MWKTPPGDNVDGLVRNEKESKTEKAMKSLLSLTSILSHCFITLLVAAVKFCISVNLGSWFYKGGIVNFVYLTLQNL